MNNSHQLYIARAMELAERGRGFVEPNPLVGAVLVRDGQVVGEGWHEKYGQVHAEVNAIAAAGDRARGSTLYVTLEPCCHQGKTPPCTDALIAAGIARVVCALEDPFPQVAGKGARRLRAAGIAVEFGSGAEEARRQNAPYLKRLATGRPYVHAKWAMTLDGKIATRAGDSKWISGEASRALVHELRGRMDAIIVGIGTALADDPLLTARPPGPRLATRVVVDRQGRLPVDSQLAKTAPQIPTLIIVGENECPVSLALALRSAGCEVWSMPAEGGRISLAACLEEMGRRGWTNVLVEGGGGLLGSFRDGDHIDEVHVFIAPRLLGGQYALGPVGGAGVEKIAAGITLSPLEVRQVEGDLYVRARKQIKTPSAR